MSSNHSGQESSSQCGGPPPDLVHDNDHHQLLDTPDIVRASEPTYMNDHTLNPQVLRDMIIHQVNTLEIFSGGAKLCQQQHSTGPSAGVKG